METLEIVKILEKTPISQDEAINGKSGLASKEDIHISDYSFFSLYFFLCL